MNYALYIIAGLIAVGTLISVMSIGKPRKPLTPGGGAFVVAVNATTIAFIVMAAVRLS